MSAPGVAAAAAADVAGAAAGAGPPPAPARPAAAGGVSAGSVFVKRSDVARAHFAEVDIFEADTVARLADRASLKRGWGVDAAYVDLFLVKPGGNDEPTAAEEGAALAQPRLQVGWLLSRALISSGAWVVARLPSLPAAAHGECACACCSQPPFVLVEQGGRRGSRDVREIPLGSSRGAHPFSDLAS